MALDGDAAHSVRRRAALRWCWHFSLIVWMARSEPAGIQAVYVLRQWHLPDQCAEAWFGIDGLGDRGILV